MIYALEIALVTIATLVSWAFVYALVHRGYIVLSTRPPALHSDSRRVLPVFEMQTKTLDRKGYEAVHKLLALLHNDSKGVVTESGGFLETVPDKYSVRESELGGLGRARETLESMKIIRPSEGDEAELVVVDVYRIALVICQNRQPGRRP
jgi:hypothetical protein